MYICIYIYICIYYQYYCITINTYCIITVIMITPPCAPALARLWTCARVQNNT